jgi:hypothetical protein
MAIDSRGYARCERDVSRSNSLAQAAENQRYRAEVARGDAISAELSKVQKKLKRTEYEYINYANAIVGNCNGNDFRVFVEYASGAKADMPETSGSSVDPAAGKDAVDPAQDQAITRAIAANMAINYARLDACVVSYNALIDWHTKGATHDDPER